MNQNNPEEFLQSFWKQYVKDKKGSRLLSNCTIAVCSNLKDYYRLIGTRKPTTRIKTLPSNQMIWVILDQEGIMLSSLHMTYCNNCLCATKPHKPHKPHILKWSYSYTKDDPKYRRCGLNLALRLASMLWANHNGWNYLNSVPFEMAHSNFILQKLEFEKIYDESQEFIYLKDITDKKKLQQSIHLHLEKYL